MTIMTKLTKNEKKTRLKNFNLHARSVLTDEDKVTQIIALLLNTLITSVLNSTLLIEVAN